VADRGTYIKMSDSLPEHRKIVAAGGDAAWLHVCALAYASRNLTDGFIPEDFVPRLSDRKQPAKLAAKLVDVWLWHATGHECKRCPQPQPGEYVIHDYLEHQRSAARVAEVSAARASAGRTGGTKSKPKPKQVASELVESGFAVAEANGERSFTETEGVLRTPQTEADAKVPPPAGAGKPRRQSADHEPNVGDVVAAYVDGATGAGLEPPAGALKARVGKQARELLREGKPIEKLIAAAGHMGAVGWDDLARQVQRDSASANGAGAHLPYSNPADDADYERRYGQ
jgi:hypothetical protein